MLRTPTPFEHRLDRLTAEVQDLRAVVSAAVGHLPKPGCRWISPADLAAEVGVSARAIQNWLSAGRFPANTYKTRSRGAGHVYLLDRELAMAAVERIICGEA